MIKLPANLSKPSITHSCALIISERLFLIRKLITLSGPNLTILPVPAGSLIIFGYIPKSWSESVGSDHNISTTNYYSGVVTSCITSSGLYKFSISLT